MSDNKKIGKLGEDIGVKYLKNKGYKILDRNFEKRVVSMKFGEIDIIAKKDKTIIFCEVKTLIVLDFNSRKAKIRHFENV